MGGRGSSSGKAGSGNVDIKSLSPREKTNYEVAMDMLNSLMFKYDPHSLKSMREAAAAVNETFSAEELELGEKGIYGIGGSSVINAYVKQLESDYAKEYKKWNKIIKKSEKSIPKTPQKKSDEAAAKERARERRERWEKDNGVKLK